ncbi:cytochrome P450 [Epithele typhae]|uniref:cytochrome P450 n=1 Tax=Epithele typhae TaxID=378194 RepID=UPI00200868C5|nr:cytochrome P450 [Epithele typhae]KAH9917869.1 cytochrome P450 [Epithele typhae]
MSSMLPAATACAAGLYLLFKFFGNYVKRSSLDILPGPPPDSWLTGNVTFSLFNKRGLESWTQYAETYGRAIVFRFILGQRVLAVHDAKALQTMMIKDTHIWQKSDTPTTLFDVFLGPGVLSIDNGERHRRQKKLLNPVFSAAHVRDMTGIFYGVSHKLRDAIKSRLPSTGATREFDINDWMGRTTLEMLGQAGLGYSFDDFTDNSMDAFADAVKSFFPSLAAVPGGGFPFNFLTDYFSVPNVRRVFRLFPLGSVREIQRISDFMAARSTDIIREKRVALEKGDVEMKHRIGEGKDLMSICLKANMTAAENERLTDEELIAQVSTFILAGMDTTSNALSRTLHLLATHPDAQDRLRAEIVEAQGGDGSDITYDDLLKLPFLDAVCRETLRLYAPVPFLNRFALEDTILPLSKPVRTRDGKEISELAISKGTFAFVNFQACNVDSDLWGPDAREWKPERWLAPLPTALEEARIPGVYAHLMTFSGGSRSCIGFKFSQVEMKIVLGVLLSSFAFELTGESVSWLNSVVVHPAMGDSLKPELRLKVKLVGA